MNVVTSLIFSKIYIDFRSCNSINTIVAVVYSGFLASKIIILKLIGMGIGLTVILDASLIRCVLLPAIMSVMGPYVSILNFTFAMEPKSS